MMGSGGSSSFKQFVSDIEAKDMSSNPAYIHFVFPAKTTWKKQVERSLSTPEIHGSNPDIGKMLSTNFKTENTKTK